MIEIRNLCKKFGNRWVTHDLSMTVPDGQMTCIVGRSGEGKSVLLKQVIGLIEPTSGSIIIDNVDITGLNRQGKQELLKKCGYVFQFAALLDSLNIFENVALPLLEAGMSKTKALPLVIEKLALMNLSEDILYKMPSEISGGMKKRVGIARSLIHDPQIILYDEPTSGLDPITARMVHELMFSMQKNFGMTSIVISHDIEIFKYADNIALLHEGKIQYFGTSSTVWDSQNPYIYQFIRGLSQGPITT